MGGGPMVSVAGGVACVLLVALVIWAVVAYQQLVRLRDQADTSWAQIDVLLKRRYDLIPHLAESMRAGLMHDRGTLEPVVAARAEAMRLARGAGPAERSRAENALGHALARMIAVGESWPEVRTDPDFTALRVELITIADKIAYERQFFAGAVRSYNDAVRGLPTNLIAGLGGFRAREPFPAPRDERGPVGVRF